MFSKWVSSLDLLTTISKKPMLASAFLFLTFLPQLAHAFGVVEFHLQPWSAPCTTAAADQPLNCALPVALAPEQVLSLNAAATSSIAVASQPWSIDTRMSGTLSVTAVPAADETPAYIQIKIEIIQPTRAVCLTSQRWSEQTALVPIICIAYGPMTLTESGLTVTGTLAN